jgi:hypothetical protein
MKIKLYKPENQLLQQHIESFYILTRKPVDKTVTYIAFPGIRYFVSINENSIITGNEHCFKFKHFPDKSPVSNFIYNLNKPHFFSMKGKQMNLTSALNL